MKEEKSRRWKRKRRKRKPQEITTSLLLYLRFIGVKDYAAHVITYYTLSIGAG